MCRKLKTRDMLVTMGVLTTNICLMCHASLEYIEHLYFQCPFNMLCLHRVQKWLRVRLPNTLDQIAIRKWKGSKVKIVDSHLSIQPLIYGPENSEWSCVATPHEQHWYCHQEDHPWCADSTCQPLSFGELPKTMVFRAFWRLSLYCFSFLERSSLSLCIWSVRWFNHF